MGYCFDEIKKVGEGIGHYLFVFTVNICLYLYHSIQKCLSFDWVNDMLVFPVNIAMYC